MLLYIHKYNKSCILWWKKLTHTEDTKKTFFASLSTDLAKRQNNCSVVLPPWILRIQKEKGKENPFFFFSRVVLPWREKEKTENVNQVHFWQSNELSKGKKERKGKYILSILYCFCKNFKMVVDKVEIATAAATQSGRKVWMFTS